MSTIPPELMSRVPGCETGEAALSVQALAGGRGVNSVWRVCTRDGDFVLRVRHVPVDRPGSFSRFELASHRLAAAANLAPQVRVAAPDGRWLVMDFVTAPVWSDARLQSDAGIDALCEMLRRLHALACPALPAVDAPGIARGYLEAITALQPEHAGSAAAEFMAIERASRDLARLSDRLALNHGDLMASNVLGSEPLLVDWEYAQRADPTWDVACLLAYYPGLEARLDRILAACGLDSTDDRQILSLQRSLFAGLDRLWRRAEPGDWIS